MEFRLADGTVAKCSIRVSPKARYARIRVSAADDVEVVLPRGFARSRVGEFLVEKSGWLNRTIARMREETRRIEEEHPHHGEVVPSVLELRSMGAVLPLRYRRSGVGGVRVIESSSGLVVSGGIGAERPVKDALKRWLARTAREELVPRLDELSSTHGLPYARAAIRGQKSRWGSCSAAKTISLNYKLLFLPPALVSYVMVHELCHTRHLNHGKGFYRLLCSLEPDFKRLEAGLKASFKFVPMWVTRD